MHSLNLLINHSFNYRFALRSHSWLIMKSFFLQLAGHPGVPGVSVVPPVVKGIKRGLVSAKETPENVFLTVPVIK